MSVLLEFRVCFATQFRFTWQRPAVKIVVKAPSKSLQESINGAGVASNPGNNLYITGLSTRITSSDLEKYFNSAGKAKRSRGRTPTAGRYQGLRDK
ncbi:hypothetical protein NC652_001138 [Populus alba x Populus x berolinensis]|nr:hypothetical protein NC652_001138 [Populus alba x Populus x berolinensis]